MLVYEDPDDPERGFDPRITYDGRYLVIIAYKGTDPRNDIYYVDLQDPSRRVIRLLDDFDANYVLAKKVQDTFPQGMDDTESGQGYFYVNVQWAAEVASFITAQGGTPRISDDTQGEHPLIPMIHWAALRPSGFLPQEVTR